MPSAAAATTIRARRRLAVKPHLIVVGVDGSEESRAALRWAVEEARLRDARIRVVHAWWAYPALAAGTPIAAADWAALEESADRFVTSFVTETLGEPDDLQIDASALHGSAAEVLVEASARADLLVVGSRGHGGFAGLLLGSVSQQCAHHALCPLVIVRGARTGHEAPETVSVGAVAGR
jgi:nucleotide-binding universal stress UspA family protein